MLRHSAGTECYRIILKSNCPVPIDVWLVSGHHKEQRQDMQQPHGHPQAAMASLAAEQQADMHPPGQAALPASTYKSYTYW